MRHPATRADQEQAAAGSKKGVFLLIAGLTAALVVGLWRWLRGLPD